MTPTPARRRATLRHIKRIVGNWPTTVTVTRKVAGPRDVLGAPQTTDVTVAVDLEVMIQTARQKGNREYQRAETGQVVVSTHTMFVPFADLDESRPIQPGDVVSDGTHEYEALFISEMTPGQHQEVALYLIG